MIRIQTDDADVSDMELLIDQGGNGDVYLSIGPKGFRYSPNTVRLSTSGGAIRKYARLVRALLLTINDPEGEDAQEPAKDLDIPGEDEAREYDGCYRIRGFRIRWDRNLSHWRVEWPNGQTYGHTEKFLADAVEYCRTSPVHPDDSIR